MLFHHWMLLKFAPWAFWTLWLQCDPKPISAFLHWLLPVAFRTNFEIFFKHWGSGDVQRWFYSLPSETTPPRCLKEALYFLFFYFVPCRSDLTEWGQQDVVVRPSDGVGKLVEDDGFTGDRDVLLHTVVAVVHTHTHHLLRGQHWGQQLDVWSLQHTLTRGQRSEEEERVINVTAWSADMSKRKEIPVISKHDSHL